MGLFELKLQNKKTYCITFFPEAAVQSGYSLTEDYNGYKQEGIGAADMTVHEGTRWSTAKGYLEEYNQTKISVLLHV